jgi:hypothetical protein
VVETDSVSPTKTDASIAAKHYVGLSKKLNVVQIRIFSGVIFNEGLASSRLLSIGSNAEPETIAYFFLVRSRTRL